MSSACSAKAQTAWPCRGMDKLTPPNRPQTIEPHQSAYPVSAHSQTTLGHGSAQSAATVGFVAGGKGGFEMHAGGTNNGRGHTLPEHGCVCVVARAADFKDAAGLAHSDFGASLLLQVFNKFVAHLSFRAKKADTFFKVSTSPLSCLFSSSNCLMR